MVAGWLPNKAAYGVFRKPLFLLVSFSDLVLSPHRLSLPSVFHRHSVFRSKGYRSENGALPSFSSEGSSSGLEDEESVLSVTWGIMVEIIGQLCGFLLNQGVSKCTVLVPLILESLGCFFQYNFLGSSRN